MIAFSDSDWGNTKLRERAQITVNGNLARCLRHQGRLTEAEQIARQALQDEMSSEDSNASSIICRIFDLRDILIAKGATDDAQRLFSIANRISVSDGQVGEATLFTAIASLRKREELEGFLDLSLNLRDKEQALTIGSSTYSLDLAKRGYYGRNGDPLLLYKNTIGYLHAMIGDSQSDGRDNEWVKLAEKADFVESIRCRLMAGSSLSRYGSMDKLLEARTQFELAWRRSSEIYGTGNPLTLQCQIRLAETKLRLGEIPAATSELTRALDEEERLRTRITGSELDRAMFSDRLSFRSAALNLAAANLLGAKKNPGDAFVALERGNARALLDMMSSAISDSSGQHAAGASLEQRRLREAVDDARIAIADMEAMQSAAARRAALVAPTQPAATKPTKGEEFDTFEKQFIRARVRVEQTSARVREQLGQRLTDATPSSLQEVQASLQYGDVLLTSQASDGFWLTVVVTRDHVAGDIVRLNEKASSQFQDALQKLRASVSSRDGADAKLSDVMQTLLASWLPPDVRSMIEGSKRIIILDSPILTACPLEVLAAAIRRPELVKDKTILYVPSGSFLTSIKARPHRRAAPTSVLAVGDPDFSAASSRANLPNRGATVLRLDSGGRAQASHLAIGDLIIKIGDVPIATPADSTRAMAQAEAARSDTVKVAFWRSGAEKAVDMQMAAGKEVGMTLGSADLAPYLGNLGETDRDRVAGVSQIERLRLFGGALNAVPVTGAQARSVAKLFGDNNAALLLRKDATLAHIEQAVAGKRYVLLGTHGTTGSRDRPYDACLALTQPLHASADDIGFLTLERVLRTWEGKLTDCDLVVLSACSTQSGQMVGDSMMSLPVGFMRAGASSVVASLWEVDGVAAAILVKRLFENLLGKYESPRDVCGISFPAHKPMSKGLALAEAKQWLRSRNPEQCVDAAVDATGIPRDQLQVVTLGGIGNTVASGAPTANHFDFSKPYYWAAFVLVGDPD